jgi:hypothetical protein
MSTTTYSQVIARRRYQCNAALGLPKALKGKVDNPPVKPQDAAAAILAALAPSPLVRQFNVPVMDASQMR